MSKPPTFAEVVDAADALSEEEQEQLMTLLSHRIPAAARQRLVDGVHDAEAEYAAGKARAMSVDEFMSELEQSSEN